MRAHVLHSAGESASIELTELPRPQPGAGEVLVRNHYAALNWGDTQIRRGVYPNMSHLEFPLVMGEEFAGVVEAVGPDVSGIEPGQPVAASNLDRGGFAEYSIAKATRVIALPDDIDLADAAGFFVVAHTAYHLLFSAYELKPGDRVLIHAITGGVGLLATQMAVDAGATVFGTTYSPHKIEGARALGAAEVIDRNTTDFVDRVMELTAGEGVGLVIDSLGGETMWQSFDALAYYGRVVNIGETQGWPEGDVHDLRDKLYERSTSFAGFELDVCEGTERWRRGTEFCVDKLRSGSISVPIAKIFPFEDCNKMFAEFESRALSGKCLLQLIES